MLSSVDCENCAQILELAGVVRERAPMVYRHPLTAQSDISQRTGLALTKAADPWISGSRARALVRGHVIGRPYHSSGFGIPDRSKSLGACYGSMCTWQALHGKLFIRALDFVASL